MAILVNKKEFRNINEFVKKGRGCATNTPNHYQISRNDERIAKSRRTSQRPENITIPVRFIHITDNGNGIITEAQREKQIQVLNDAFSSYGIFFNYLPSDVVEVENIEWFYMDKDSIEERLCKRALQSDPTKYLNFYTGGLASGLLGWATFPWSRDGDMESDGVVILNESLPDGNEENYNFGMTAVHEVGHWLGLYHTFQGGCKAYGDHVGDTPSHSEPSYGKPEPDEYEACDGSQAPIHNFMNYVEDEWMKKFTTGQMNRVWEHIILYRKELI